MSDFSGPVYIEDNDFLLDIVKETGFPVVLQWQPTKDKAYASWEPEVFRTREALVEYMEKEAPSFDDFDVYLWSAVDFIQSQFSPSVPPDDVCSYAQQLTDELIADHADLYAYMNAAGFDYDKTLDGYVPEPGSEIDG